MIPFRADLHCHSSCSDGTMKPQELISLASQKNLQALSITDHDTINAYTDDLQLSAKQLGLELLPGVEFSTVLNNVSVHLLGYGFRLDSPQIAALCVRHKNRRTNRYRAILELLNAKGMPITEEELLEVVAASAPSDQPTTVGRPHIALAMIQRGYVGTIQEAFRKYLGDGCSCYVQGEHVTPEETIDVIHQAGGVAIIAHPHLVKDQKILLQLLDMNFDGIECYYSRFPTKDHQRWLKIARHRNWLITGGSDFHGTVKPTISLGCSWIDEELFRRLQARVNP
jgi:3',5'-nucleoside bisphosphate phosphatase